MKKISKWGKRQGRLRATIMCALLMLAHGEVRAAMLETGAQEPFGTFRGVEFVRYTGFFSGETLRGAFRVPYEIVAPVEPRRGNGTVVIEPPHFLSGTGGRDDTLGHSLLFGRGFSHASVGFSEFGGNMLDPSIMGAVIAGESAVVDSFPISRDVEIIKQFSEALVADPYAWEILGHVSRRYGYGVSQTAEVWFDVFYNTDAEGILDLTVMNVPVWRPPFAEPWVLEVLPEEFTPLAGIGKVMFVNTEGDFFISGAQQLRKAVTGPARNPDYRMYEVAGAPHVPLNIQLNGVQLNPLDNGAVVRAVFMAGDRWVRRGFRPPRSALLKVAPPGEIDPVYDVETGIARDADGNARGGVRFPDLATGRALFVASDDDQMIPGFPPGLVGTWTDLACDSRPGSPHDRPRFRNHGTYVRAVAHQLLRLVFRGYLLFEDALDLLDTAADSDVGKPGFCDGP